MEFSRRNILAGTIGLGLATTLASCGFGRERSALGVSAINARESALPATGAVRNFDLIARLSEVDLGGAIVKTWTYGGELPGKIFRINKGDRMKVVMRNNLPVATSVHWHGLAIRNDMDGIPGVTMAETTPSHIFNYDFIAPDAGTYWFHPHSGVQLDRGLYAPLIIDDPAEIVNYNAEWIVILDDWTDGLGKNPDQILAGLIKSGGGQPTQSSGAHSMDGMGSMDGAHNMDGMGGVDGGDVTYPKMLINGRPLNDPEIFHAKPGDKIRLRIINAAADTIFRVALDQHSMSVTHSDGFPVTPLQTSLLQIGMGERYDLIVTMKDGLFALVAQAEGKNQAARAFIRTGAGALPPTSYKVAALSGKPLTAFSLEAANSVRLPAKKPDRIQQLILTGGMAPYSWKINGKSYSDSKALTIQLHEMGRLQISNETMMSHPIHLHGHTFQLGAAGGKGARKDTVLLSPMGSVNVDFEASNPGKWMIHCHNIYHAESGMMTRLDYKS